MKMGKNRLLRIKLKLFINFPFRSYILFVRKNALQILVPKFGLEGTIYVIGKDNQPCKPGVVFTYDEEVGFIKIVLIHL